MIYMSDIVNQEKRTFRTVGKTRISCSHTCKKNNEHTCCEVCTNPHVFNVKVNADTDTILIGWCNAEDSPKQIDGKPRICIECSQELLGSDVIEEL